MTLRLILMRHAKSDWDHPSTEDFDRPLNGRGRKSAKRVGKWLHKRGYHPDLVLCSAAARTRETWALVSSEIGPVPEIEFRKGLYLASPEAMFHAMSMIENSETVLMLAHNPGSAFLATNLVSAAPNHPRFDDYPSAATAVIDFDIDRWGALTAASGRVVDFVIPRELDDDGNEIPQ